MRPRMNLNDPFYAEFRFQQTLNIWIPGALYSILFAFLFVPFSIAHFRSSPFASSRSRGLATKLRKWAMGRWVLRVGKLWRWDLRGNRGLLLCFAFVLLYDFLACWVHTSAPPPDQYSFPKGRLIANRAGNLCFMQFPLIMLLVTRKNAISWATGTSLQDLVFLHRWVGWSTFGLGAVHVGIYGSYAWGNWQYFWGHLQRPYYLFGVIAAISFLLIVVLSMKWVRKNYHEVFLVSHVVFSIIFFISCYLHWKPRFLGPALAMAIYFATRLHRVLLLVHHHVIAPLEARLRQHHDASMRSAVSSLGPSSAVVNVMDERAMKISIALPEGVRWEAGQWVQLSFIERGLGIGEWHPFSIASIPSSPPKRSSFSSASSLGGGSLVVSPASIAENLPLLRPDSPPAPLYSPASPLPSYPPSTVDPPPEASPSINFTSSSNTMSFIVTPHDSLTRRLYEKAANSPSGSPLRTKVLIDGPYGVPPHLHGVETLVMVAGGTGIAFVSAVWRQLLRKQGDVRKMVLVWSVREEHHLAWLPLPHLISLLPASLSLSTHFHYTGPSSTKHPEDSEYHSFLNAKKGRPDIRGIVQGASDEAEGRVLIIVCGPSSLSDAVVDAATATCDPGRVARGDLGGDVRVEVELFD